VGVSSIAIPLLVIVEGEVPLSRAAKNFPSDSLLTALISYSKFLGG
jgi:hypothetical protein